MCLIDAGLDASGRKIIDRQMILQRDGLRPVKKRSPLIHKAKPRLPGSRFGVLVGDESENQRPFLVVADKVSHSLLHRHHSHALVLAYAFHQLINDPVFEGMIYRHYLIFRHPETQRSAHLPGAIVCREEYHTAARGLISNLVNANDINSFKQPLSAQTGFVYCVDNLLGEVACNVAAYLS